MQKQHESKVIRSKKAEKKQSKEAALPDKVQGEGNYEAAARYDQGVRDFAQSGAVPKSANDAKRAVEQDRALLEKAEQIGKRGTPRGS